jgi:hypothetical protein
MAGHGGGEITDKLYTTRAVAFKNRRFLIARNVVSTAIALRVVFCPIPCAKAAYADP